MRLRLVRTTTLVGILTLTIAACGGSSTTTTAASGGNLQGDLVGAGATFPNPVFQDWRFDYKRFVQPGVNINYQSIGSGGGITHFL